MNSLQLRKARVRFERPTFPLKTLDATLLEGFRRLPPLRAGARVAITAGSRGIANIALITRGVVDAVRQLGGDPFIVPAMGSHGGATAEGQVAVIASLGITAESMGCPVRSSMDVARVEAPGLQVPLHMDANAHGADAIVLVNRIKVHTDYHGTYESGLVKMAVIGLGKRTQAEIVHTLGTRGLRDLIPPAARHLLSSGRILAGVGIVENAYDETACVEVIPALEVMERELRLLDMARRNMPRLPVERLDVLIVRELGKNISGTGMDTNIIGRSRVAGEPEPTSPEIRAVVALGVTPESHGNAIGVGLADTITTRLLREIDMDVVRTNAVTAGFLERGKIPLAFPTDAEAYSAGLRTSWGVPAGEERVMCIQNTLHVSEIFVSAALEAELSRRADVEWVGDYQPAFDEQGALRTW